MRTERFLIGVGAAVLATLAGGAFAEPVAIQEAMTYEQLVLARRKSEALDPMRHLPVVKGEDPSVVNRPKSLMEDSDIISFGRSAVLVPKRAILQIPKTLSDRLHMQPGAVLQSWSEFYAANRGWITTVEVSRIQAEGNDSISDETKTVITKSGNLVVATYLGGPISVLPLKVPVEKTPDKTSPKAKP